ncbi:MAG: 16S rRNA (cytosine(1402)-N(4))-methyltransferase RsmH [Pseudomonadota bacterium]
MSADVERSAHLPVLPRETMAALTVRADGNYIDATFGRGGHAALILAALSEQGRLLVIDRDPVAIETAMQRFGDDSRVLVEHGVFSDVALTAAQHGMDGHVHGILFDFGVSSPQLDDPERGFSFRTDGPLDMRMDPTRGDSAADYLATVAERDLARALATLGEERHARRIARAIAAERERVPLTRTGQLAELIRNTVPSRPNERIDPATRSFQAIRIVVNRELAEIDAALAAAVPLLAAGGRMAAISFHSLEDRRVKRFIRNASEVAEPYRGLPDIPPAYRPTLRPIGKLIRAAESEVDENPRARSARLRVAERMAA